MNGIPTEWSADTRDALEDVGWFPGRNVAADADAFAKRVEAETGVRMFASARKALEEFGGLVIRRGGPGVHCGRSSLQFDYDDFPTARSLADVSKLVGKPLYAIGEIDRLPFLAVAEDGAAYAIGDVPDHVQFLAESIHGAVEAVLQGQLPWMDPLREATVTRPAQTIVVAGFSWDIASVLAQLGDLGRSIVTYDEHTSAEYDAAIPSFDIVVYVFGADTHASSQLHGHFGYLHVARRPAREFILRLPTVGPRSFIFSVIAAVPQIDIDELRRLIAGA